MYFLYFPSVYPSIHPFILYISRRAIAITFRDGTYDLKCFIYNCPPIDPRQAGFSTAKIDSQRQSLFCFVRAQDVLNVSDIFFPQRATIFYHLTLMVEYYCTFSVIK